MVWWAVGTDVHARGVRAFWRACEGGHLETAKWLLSLGGVDVHAVDDAFVWACEGGHLDTAKWLWGSFGPALDVRVVADRAFRRACGIRHRLETARWLANLDLEWIKSWNLGPIKTWRKARDAWIHAVVSLVGVDGWMVHACL